MADKPEITIPDGPPPTELGTEDLVMGSGAEATTGKTVDVHYVGVSWSTKKEFDASWKGGPEQTFNVGLCRQGTVPGFAAGPIGMKVGGRRRLTIPPALGYGDRGAGGAIKPGETLVFVVDLLGVR